MAYGDAIWGPAMRKEIRALREEGGRLRADLIEAARLVDVALRQIPRGEPTTSLIGWKSTSTPTRLRIETMISRQRDPYSMTRKYIWDAVEAAVSFDGMPASEFMKEVRDAWREAMDRKKEDDLEQLDAIKA